ncbi:hypothetical protein CR513_14526, partial [Mucuna pruriens]
MAQVLPIIQSNTIGQNTEIDITHVPTGLQVVDIFTKGLQVADIFTKGLPTTRFQELNGKLGMIDIHLPT